MKKTGKTYAAVRLTVLILMICMIGFPLLADAGAWNESSSNQKPKSVLILNSYHQGYSWSDRIMEGIESGFADSGLHVEKYFEYLDTKRYPPEGMFLHLEALYQSKYASKKFDVIITSDNNALDFMLSRNELFFQDVPIVFCGVNSFEHSMLKGYDNITGVVEEPNFEDTLNLALRLHPNTRRIVVIHDRSVTGMALLGKLQKILPHYQEKVQIEYITNVTVDQLKVRLRSLPDDCIVFHLSFYLDKAGVFLSREEVGRLVAQNAPVPVFTCWEDYMGDGVLGGNMVSGREQGRLAADMAARILRGASAGDIPIVRNSPNPYMFDYQQMRRFNIKEADLPAGSVISNQPFSLYESYKSIIWGAMVTLIVLLAIIGFLVANIVLRKRAEAAQLESERKYRILFEQSRDAITITTEDGNYVDMNAAYLDLHGYEKEELARLKADVVWADPAGRLAWRQVMNKQGNVVDYYFQLVRKDGAIRDATLTSTMRQAKDGVVLYQNIIRDITDRKRVEDSLRFTQHAVDHSLEGVQWTDVNGRFIYVNKATCQYLGYSENELLKLSIFDIDPNFHKDHFCKYLNFIRENRSAVTESQHIHKDGHIIPVEISTTYVEFGGNEYLCCYVRDIFERKRAEQALVRYRDRLEELVEERTRELREAHKELIKREKLAALGQLTATVSHELRNPLGVIVSSAYYLRRNIKDKTAKIRNHVDRIEKQVKICDALVEDLLEYTRGRLIETSEVDFNSWLRNILDELVDHEELAVHMDFENGIEPITLDPWKFRMVVANLINNAVQAVEEKKKEVGAENSYQPRIDVATRHEAGEIKLTIEDNGLGMDEATLLRAFEPFYTTKARGTGLGLANVKKIVDEHKGRVSLESLPDRSGIRVRVYLPDRRS